MKMFTLIYHKVLSDEVRRILRRTKVTAYSEIPKILGVGPQGIFDDSRYSLGHVVCLFAAVPDEWISKLVAAFQELTDRQRKLHGKPAVLHVFIMECTQAI